MAKTLLNGVNELLKRVNEVAGDAAALTTLTDSARQHPIDLAVQVINEGIGKLFSVPGMVLPKRQGSSTLTLVTSTRAYALASDVVTLHWPFIDRTNAQFIEQYPGGYDAMLIDDPEQDDTGLARYATIRPTDGYLYLDAAPTSVENGRVYTYQYDKDLVLDEAADTMPFGDAAFRAMVPAWVQLYKREKRNEFDTELYRAALGEAARLVSQIPPRDSYSPRAR
jgi:hypothetical protein